MATDSNPPSDPALRSARSTLRVLVVDDDEDFMHAVERSLRRDGFDVQTAMSATGLRELLRSFRPDVALVDVHMPAMTGGDVIASVRGEEDAASTRFVLFSGMDADDLARLAHSGKADGWLTKSTPFGELGPRIRRFVP